MRPAIALGCAFFPSYFLNSLSFSERLRVLYYVTASDHKYLNLNMHIFSKKSQKYELVVLETDGRLFQEKDEEAY